MILLEGKLEDELSKIIRAKAPQEAVGLILNEDEVVELPNHSSTPTNHFEVHKVDILGIIGHLDIDPQDVIFWHSHPSGGIGPSRTDLQQKTLFHYHLVLALIDGTIVPSWY